MAKFYCSKYPSIKIGRGLTEDELKELKKAKENNAPFTYPKTFIEFRSGYYETDEPQEIKCIRKVAHENQITELNEKPKKIPAEEFIDQPQSPSFKTPEEMIPKIDASKFLEEKSKEFSQRKKGKKKKSKKE